MLECLTPWKLVLNLFTPHECSEIYQLTTLAEPFTLMQYLPFFLKTLLLELPIYYLFFRTLKSIPKILQINFLVNLATHPIVFFIIPMILMKLNGNYLNYLVTAEVFAPLVETLILVYYFKFSLRSAIATAICANLFS